MTTNPVLVLFMIDRLTGFLEGSSTISTYPGLRRSDRIDILRSWKHDVILLMQATDANTVRNITCSLEDINKAIGRETLGED